MGNNRMPGVEVGLISTGRMVPGQVEAVSRAFTRNLFNEDGTCLNIPIDVVNLALSVPDFEKRIIRGFREIVDLIWKMHIAVVAIGSEDCGLADIVRNHCLRIVDMAGVVDDFFKNIPPIGEMNKSVFFFVPEINEPFSCDDMEKKFTEERYRRRGLVPAHPCLMVKAVCLYPLPVRPVVTHWMGLDGKLYYCFTEEDTETDGLCLRIGQGYCPGSDFCHAGVRCPPPEPVT